MKNSSSAIKKNTASDININQLLTEYYLYDNYLIFSSHQ
jgi:hypothetical protein